MTAVLLVTIIMLFIMFSKVSDFRYIYQKFLANNKNFISNPCFFIWNLFLIGKQFITLLLNITVRILHSEPVILGAALGVALSLFSSSQ
jgi:hypothetical protein